MRQVVNEVEEEKKLHKANSLKYERRAKYTLDKFNEIKAKEMQLIQMGEEKVRGEINLIETKYKKKIATLNEKMKKLEEENVQMKMKSLEKNNQRNYRLELEKS